MYTYLKEKKEKEMNDVVNDDVNDDVMSAVILKTSNDSHCHTEWYNMMASRRQWQYKAIGIINMKFYDIQSKHAYQTHLIFLFCLWFMLAKKKKFEFYENSR